VIGFRSAVGAGRSELGEGGFRTITVSSMSGSSSVPTTRSVDRNFSESLLIGSMTSVDDVVRPSPVTPLALMIQALSERVHSPWPKSPSESNTHDRICLACGSQPIHCVPLRPGSPATWIEYLRTRNF